ncbi:MAG: hypothetical protein JW699_06955 [Chitinispirillaceae bacterium]|nr:hypothetical protein [Chitinispirillaceae bacterium]
MSLSDVIKTALDQLQCIAKTETVIGEPIVAGTVTLIPVSKVSIGFAAGGAGRDDKCATGAGTGGGITITPVAFLSIIDGRVQVHPVSPEDPFLSWVADVAPEAVKKVSSLFGKKDAKNDGKETSP